jgi:predicted transcriptional regulator of viral defense system
MEGAGHKASDMATFRARPADVGLAELAARQYGVVPLTQLKALGVSASAARDRAAAGRLHRVYRGVYAVGHSVLGGHGRWMAAALA